MMAAMAGVLLSWLVSASAAVAQTAAAPSADRIAALEKAAAANTAAIAQAQSAGDNAWMLVSAALVLLMSGPGLALFYGGLVRKKNVLATMMQTFAMMAVDHGAVGVGGVLAGVRRGECVYRRTAQHLSAWCGAGAECGVCGDDS